MRKTDAPEDGDKDRALPTSDHAVRIQGSEKRVLAGMLGLSSESFYERALAQPVA